MSRLVCVCLAAVIACGLSCNNKPKISDTFRTQLTAFLQQGAKTAAMASRGVTYSDLTEQVVNTRAAYNLVAPTWPASFANGTKADLEHVLTGWDLALDLWKLKLDDSDAPVEPDVNKYTKYVDYGGEGLALRVHEPDYIVKHYRGKKYVSFENIGVLLHIADSTFDKAKDEALLALQ